MKNRLKVILIILCVAVSAAAGMAGVRAQEAEEGPATRTLAGVELPGRVEVEGEGEALPRRGEHLLRWWGFKVYIAVLYVDDDVRGFGELLGADTPRELHLHYMREISREDLREATEKALGRQEGLDQGAVRERFERLYGWYQDVEGGDTIRLTYVPGEGTRFALNGERVGTMPGEDFAQALFGIWIGPDPISRSMRDDLIGRED